MNAKQYYNFLKDRTVVLRASKNQEHDASYAIYKPLKSKQNNIESVVIEGELLVVSYTNWSVAFD